MKDNMLLISKVLLALSIANIIPFASSFIKSTLFIVIIMLAILGLMSMYYKFIEIKIGFVLTAILLSSPFLYTFVTTSITINIVKWLLWAISVVIALMTYRIYLKLNLLAKRGMK